MPEHVPGRRLTVDFAAWLDDQPVAEADYYQRGLIALDANVLLDLYRVNPNTRNQVIATLAAVGERLWVPHQAAVEFSRNRKQAVIDRQVAFKRVRLALRDAADKAVRVLESALDDLEWLRQRNGATEAWDPSAVGLDRESLQRRLLGVTDPAIGHLDMLRDQHDLSPKDMQATDTVLRQVDELLAGRIGPAYSSAVVRDLIDEAVNYRYPNEIPPGYRDYRKETSLHAVGDFLVWRQIIDHANKQPPGDRLVLLITQEQKPDWWAIDEKGTALRPRPELMQEMRDTANAHLRLTSLADFLKSAGTYLMPEVSEQAVDDLRRATPATGSGFDEAHDSPIPDLSDLLGLDPFAFERMVVSLLAVMGYPKAISFSSDHGADAVVDGDGMFGAGIFLVEARRYRGPIHESQVHALYGRMKAAPGIDGGIFVSSSRFTASSHRFAEDKNIHLVTGDELLRLVAAYLIPGDD